MSEKLIKLDSPRRYGWQGAEVFTAVELESDIYKPRISFMLPKADPGAVVVVAEEANWRERSRKLFVMHMEQFTDAMLLLDRVAEIKRYYDVDDTYCRLSRVERDILYTFNSDRKYRDHLFIMRPPRANDKGDLTFHINLLRDLLRSGRERVFFPQDSAISGLLQAIPDMPAGSVTDDKFPAFAALAYGIAALYHYPTVEPEEKSGFRKKKEYDPFRPDDPIMSADPWKMMDDDNKF